MIGGIPSIHEDRECPRWGALVESRNLGEWPRDLQREKWRAHIRVGDVIDAKDSEGRWFDSRSWRWTATGSRSTTTAGLQMGLVGRPEGRVDPAALTHTDDWRRLKVGDALEMRGPGEKALWYKGFVKEVDGSRVPVVLAHAERRQAVARTRRSTSVS